jgi:hypothetical protein
MNGGWMMVEARAGWWLERRDLESGFVVREPIALWAWDVEDAEVRPVVVGEARAGVERGLWPVDVRSSDVEGVVYAPAERPAERRTSRAELERRAWT